MTRIQSVSLISLVVLGIILSRVNVISGFDSWIHDGVYKSPRFNDKLDCSTIHHVAPTNYPTILSRYDHIKLDLSPNDNSTHIEKPKTPFALLETSIASSFMLILFTEFGDRTFLLAALLVLKSSRLLVFTGTSAALVIQTGISTTVGQLLHYIPQQSKIFPLLFSIPFDDYGAAILLFIFGCVHIRAALTEEHTTDDLALHKESIKHQGSARSFHPTDRQTSCDVKRQQSVDLVPMQISDNRRSPPGFPKSSYEDVLLQNDNSPYDEITPFYGHESHTDLLQLCTEYENMPSPLKIMSNENHQEEPCNSQRIIVTESNEHVVTTQSSYTLQYIFWAIFAAEFGDKSMISTIALATAQNPYGVLIGSSCAHILLTATAVVAGKFLDGIVSERFMNVVGAILFIGSAVLTTLEGLARQGIGFRWVLADFLSAIFSHVVFFSYTKN